MKIDSPFLEKIQKLVERQGAYKLEAFGFVLSALHYTLKKLSKRRHISGPEFLDGIRVYGLKQFGPLTLTVFNHWGVYTTEDFGKIVFALVDADLMSKQDTDSLEDFKNVYDFAEAFGKPHRLLGLEDPSDE